MQLSQDTLEQIQRRAQGGPLRRLRWALMSRRRLRYGLYMCVILGIFASIRLVNFDQALALTSAKTLKARGSKLPTARMFLEHTERDVNLRIKGDKVKLPRPKIDRRHHEISVMLPGVSVRPRQWTLTGSRVASINVFDTPAGSRLVLTQDPSIKGALKDAFSAEKVKGDLVLRVLNQSIASHTRALAKARKRAAPSRHPLTKVLDESYEDQGSAQMHQGKVPTLAPTIHEPNHEPNHAPNHAPSPVIQPSQPAHPKVFAQEQRAPQEGLAPVAPAPTQSWMQGWTILIASLVAFALLAIVPLWLWMRSKNPPKVPLKILERVPLSSKHSLVRVRLQEQEIWLGLSDGNIQVISPPGTGGQFEIPPVKLPPASMRKAEVTQTPVAKPPPPTMIRRKLKAFKSRLQEALANSEQPSKEAKIGAQAEAIRAELARRQANSENESDEYSDSGEYRDVA